MIRVEHPGLLSTVQDTGRHGWQHLGLSPGGAMDGWSARLANALVGNRPEAAVLELSLQGPRLVLERGAWLALTGADLTATADGEALPLWRPVWLPAGTRLAFGRPRLGCRAYLAVAGGFDLPPVLGSRSTDRRAGLGGLDGRALKAGDRLALRTGVLPAPEHPEQRWAPTWCAAWAEELPLDGHARLRLVPGADWAALSEAGQRALVGEAFRVSPLSDRMGLRLEGPRLELAGIVEKLSAGVAYGTLQLPPGGQPILLGVEHQTTGGYPVLGTVASVDLSRLAQLRPGEPLRFEPITVEAAQELLRAREMRLKRLLAGLALRWPLGGGGRTPPQPSP